MPAEGALRDGTAAGLELIETLRWEPGEGFVRLARHLERLANSAGNLGLLRSEDGGRSTRRLRDRARSPLRVRLTLAGDGKVNVASAPFEPLPEDAVWTAAHRQHTDQFRRSAASPQDHAPAGLRGSARRIFARGGRRGVAAQRAGRGLRGHDHECVRRFRPSVLLTPALRCGLLPGVLRGE